MVGGTPNGMAKPESAAPSVQQWLVSSIVLPLLLVGQQVVAVPGWGRVAQGLQNALHGPWFAAVTWFVLKLTGKVARGWVAIAIAAGVAVLLAAGSEAVQNFTGRDASLFDGGLNLLAGLAALCVACVGAGLIRGPAALTIAWGAIVVSAAPLARAASGGLPDFDCARLGAHWFANTVRICGQQWRRRGH